MTDRRPGVNKEKDTHKLTLTHKQSTKKKNGLFTQDSERQREREVQELVYNKKNPCNTAMERMRNREGEGGKLERELSATTVSSYQRQTWRPLGERATV